MSRIIALHGNVGSPADWLPLEQAFGPLEKRCLWEPGALDFAEGDALLGYSLGGRLALHAAATAPEKFRMVVVLSAHPGLKTQAERTERLELDQKWSERAAHLPWAEFLQQWDAQDVLGPGSADRLALERYRPAIARAFRDWSLGNQADLRPALGRLSCPLHWITGGQDLKFTDLAAGAGCGRHHIVPGAGHRLLAADLASQLAALLGSLKIVSS